jgi:hypothetical protein
MVKKKVYATWALLHSGTSVLYLYMDGSGIRRQ